MQHLLLMSLGPVQEFIATARRSRDLWFGSWLLSELSKAAAKAIEDAHGTPANEAPRSLIFPYPANVALLNPNSDFNAANKLVARIDSPPALLADAVQRAVRARLDTIAHGVLDTRPGIALNTALEQVRDLIECVWVAAALPDETKYSQVRSRLEAIMAARKATRDFRPAAWGASVPKSSLDGQRESVIPEQWYPTRGDSSIDEQNKIKALYQHYGAGPAERLSGVDIVKRRGSRGLIDGFYSTSHVAALPLIGRLTDSVAVREYIRQLEALGILPEALAPVPGPGHSVFGHYDGHLLFEERLAEFFVDEPSYQHAQQLLREFLQRQTGQSRPSPYYALLQADGDRMGQAIDHIETPERHQELSRVLATFAETAALIVELHQGSLVYAGGDDVLAFLPLHSVLQCARDLADEFHAMLQPFATADATPTLSAGIAVTHHIEPLADARTLAADAERFAKRTRNALAVTVSKRSGGDQTVAGSWDGDGVLPLDRRLAWLIDHYRAGRIPDGAAFELRDLGLRLGNALAAADLAAEAMRILLRKQVPGGQQPIGQEELRQLEAWMYTLPIKQLGTELIVARAFASA